MWLNNLFFVIPLSEECFVGSMPCLIRALTDHMIFLYQSLPLPVGDMCDGSLFGWMFIGLNFSEDNSDSLLLGGQRGFHVSIQSSSCHSAKNDIQILCHTASLCIEGMIQIFPSLTIAAEAQNQVIHVVFHASDRCS